MMGERKEAFMRIIIGIVSGIILGLWKVLVVAVSVYHWFSILFTKKRNPGISSFGNGWIGYVYSYYRYMTFSTNKRTFPFGDLKKELEPVDMKGK